MSETPLSTDRILSATEEVLRRHGSEKTNVVDVARVLGMSHANIYRHFPSKKALLDAVAARWLHRIITPLAAIAEDGSRSAAERLWAWFETLRIAKRQKITDDPEMFQVYHTVAVAARDLVAAHVTDLLGQVERIVGDGIARGEFSSRWETRTTAQACMHAMSPFHHPALLTQGPPPTDEAAHAVLGLLLAGLRAGPESRAS